MVFFCVVNKIKKLLVSHVTLVFIIMVNKAGETRKTVIQQA